MKIYELNLDFDNLTKRSKTNRIILHHTAVTSAQSVEVIHNYHKNSLGYAGIGYHYYIRKDGSIYRGRPEDTVGAHAYNNNSDSIGICFEGNFEKEDMPSAQVNAGNELVNELKNKYNISKVEMHKDVNQTSCPGKYFQFDRIVEEIKEEKPVEKPVQEEKSIDELAQEVIAGKYGNGEERKEALGDKYDEVQKRVNEILSGKITSNKKSNEEIAKEVIKGLWGNGTDRKNRLEKAGYNYNTVQSLVNQML